MPIAFDDPRFLWLLPAIVPLLWLGRKRLRYVDRWRRRVALLLRAAVLTLLVLILAGPQAVRIQSDLTVIAVLDRSSSVRQFARPPTSTPSGGQAGAQAPGAINGPTPDQWLDAQLRHAASPTFVSEADGRQAHRRPDDRYGLIAFDRKASVLALPAHGLPPESSLIQTPTEGTDPAAAIRLALALFPADTSKRMVLAWDGNATVADADVLAAARQAAAAGIPIDVIPIAYRARRQVVVESVDAPSQARTGQTVALRVVLRAASPAAGTLLVRQNGTTIDLAPGKDGLGQPITQADWLPANAAPAIQPPAQPGGTTTPNAASPTPSGGGGGFLCVRRIEIPMHDRGPNRFEVHFEPADATGLVTTNLRAEGFSFVHGRGKLLLVGDGSSSSPRREQGQPVQPVGNPLLAALTSRGLEVATLPPDAFPATVAELQPYDAVILHNIPVEELSPSQQQLLVRYVNDLGGGLIVIGGPDSFGAGGWAGSPVDPILPVSCEIPAYSVLPSGALILVIDHSGSMASPVSGTLYNQQQLANEAAVLAVRTLFPGDMVGV
ncbi:MAG: hypothetical protein IT442_10285, partial [Phycisphaeraceae bacterium]|nr:hypothetical protein [Phycisphaeraceae bacterium]